MTKEAKPRLGGTGFEILNRGLKSGIRKYGSWVEKGVNNEDNAGFIQLEKIRVWGIT